MDLKRQDMELGQQLSPISTTRNAAKFGGFPVTGAHDGA